jgi:diguanylate cyclase (GGDEF)-like protein
MARAPVTLAAVEAFIDAKHKGLTFPLWLEDQFDADTRRRRSQRLRAAMLPNLIVYNLFLIADWFLIRDQFWLAVLLHVFAVSPWILMAGLLADEQRSKFVREGAAASVPVLIVVQILCTFVLTSSVDAGHYQYFVLLVMLFTNTIQRLPYRYAVVVSLSIIALQGAAVWVSGQMSGAAASIAVVTLVVAAYLTLISNYYLERDARRSYLHGLRDRLRHIEADAAAKRDALTELGNRHLLASKIEELWSRPAAEESNVAVIMLDIDHFKLFNDRYGHVAGDVCIKRVAACVSAELRNENDTAIRYGGEEILALLPGADMRSAIRVAERIRRTVEGVAIPHEALGPRRTVTASLGVAVGPVSTISSSELIAAADAALYAAKRNGRNQVWPPLLRDSNSGSEGVPNVVRSLGQTK